MPAALRPGSADPRDWTTYVHVYPRTDGGINVQYWFFYAYNANPPFFDHDADWEHVTVRVTPQGQPLGVYFAQHGDSSPGVFRAWATCAATATIPIVLSARGSHASYPDQSSVSWFDSVSRCASAGRMPRSDLAHRPGRRAGQRRGAARAAGDRRRAGSAGVRRPLGRRGALPPLADRAAGPFHQSGFVVDGFE